MIRISHGGDKIRWVNKDWQRSKISLEAGKREFLGLSLPFGAEKYSINNITTVVDNNCMDDARERVEPDTYKYLILRPNCKLYSSWDDNGSLIF